MVKLKLLDELINEGELLSQTIYYVRAPEDVWRIDDVYSSNDMDRYQIWQSSVQRFIKTYNPSDLEEFKGLTNDLSPGNHSKIRGILNAIKLLPDEPSVIVKKIPETNITIHNSQNNTQSIVFSIFLDAIKEEITGKDLKQLTELLNEYKANPELNKPKLLDKIKSFGSDILTNMIANIITNPNVYAGLF